MTADEVAEPLVPPDVDLRDFPYMPLHVVRLRDSETAGVDDAEGFRAAVLLWCASWHQIPAASLPDDDRALARLAGYGRDLATWQRAREAGALRGWVRCADGRLYHPVVAEVALKAWATRSAQRARTEKATAERERRRAAAHAGADVPTGGDRNDSDAGGRDEGRDGGRNDAADAERNEQRNVKRNVVQGKGREGRVIDRPPLPPPDGGGDGPDDPEHGNGNPDPGGRKAKAGKVARRKGSRVTFDEFVADCRATGEQRVPPDDPVRAFAERAGIPDEFLAVAWAWFRGRYSGTSKAYADWRRHFRNTVEGNWGRLWYVRDEDSAVVLTTAGETLRRAIDAERAERRRAGAGAAEGQANA